MNNAKILLDKMRQGKIPLGTGISFSDPSVTDLITDVLDFAFIDMEHNAMSLETVQNHILATKGSETASIIRVAWNDPVLIKPILDIGADGIISPMVRSLKDVELAVSACRYPPQGIRGFGPSRPIRFGRIDDSEYCKKANEEIICIVQIEHIDAVNEITEIVRVPGLSGIMVGPNDLAGSMGHMGNPKHPEVLDAIDKVVSEASSAGIFPGIGVADDPAELSKWIKKGVKWMVIGVDWHYLALAIDDAVDRIRKVIN